MYTLSRTSYGVRVTLAGHLSADEARQWVAESRALLATMSARFHVFMDMREIRPLTDEAFAEIASGQALYETAGMDRSVVILSDPALAERFSAVARESGDDEWERYIDASSVPEWERRGIAWLERGVDPLSADIPA
jgi:hypothetical protein